MKLIICIVQDEDSKVLLEKITETGYRVTKLATTGGFLKSGNTTLLIGVEEERVDSVIEIIKTICETREQVVTSPSPIASATGVYVPYPMEVQVGGATLFVVDVDKYIKI
ncbi:MAG: cyclic-di-AMP receptor [Clostridiaceae bacterium]